MTAPELDRRIFVVGVPRSGTTLVQSLLAAHSQVTSFTESHLFARHFRLFPGSRSAVLTRDPTGRVEEFLAENGFEPTEVAAAERLRQIVPAPWLLPFRTGRVAGQLLRVFDQLAVLRGRANWVEKTPRHLRYASFLERVSDRPIHFVHVIRDGLETVASLHTTSRGWERPYSLASCVSRWNADVGFSAARRGRPTDHFVLYERLTSEPEAAVERLLTELGLPWESEFLERQAAGAARLITAEEPWKADVGRALEPSATSERVLTEAQRAEVRKSLNHDLYTRFAERRPRS